MQLKKSFLPLGAAVMILLPLHGTALEPDSDAQAKAREALRRQIAESQPAPVTNATAEPVVATPAVAPVAAPPRPTAVRPVRRSSATARAANRPVFDESLYVEEPVDPNQPKAALPPTLEPQPAPAVPPSQQDNYPRVTTLNGIVVVRALNQFNPDGVPLMSGVTSSNIPMLESPEFGRIASQYIGQPMDEVRMRDLHREIILFYRANDRPLVDVLYPEQDVSNGMLQIVVIEGLLKEIRVEDRAGNDYTNGWTGVEFIRNSIHLRTNEPISEKQLVKDLDWLNRNPFRTVEAVYEPDPRLYGLSTVLLRVDERKPWSVHVGYENSGSEITSEDRVTAGVVWGKAFGLVDHQFRYSFTSDPTVEHLRVHSASYFVPLPWRHGLRLSGYYLDVEGDVDENISLSGSAYQTSLRYEVPLPNVRRYQHELSAGLDFKFTENNLFFNEFTAANTPTEIFQIAAGYSAVLPDRYGRTSFGIQGYFSPGDVTDLNTDEDFEESRQFAKATYLYARVNLERGTTLPLGFSWIARVIGQVADGNLLPSEQLGLGGFATVRGYEEREGNGDVGYFISNEIRTPAFNPSLMAGKWLNKTAPFKDELQFLVFWDHGEIRYRDVLAGDAEQDTFSSLGVGVRYRINPYLSFRFDYGWQLNQTHLSEHSTRAHFGVQASY